jgi:hypothetical protein
MPADSEETDSNRLCRMTGTEGTDRMSQSINRQATSKPAGGPHFVVSNDGDLYGEDTPESREVARRIRACVNACEGISTEELENGIIQDMQRAIGAIVPLLEDKRDRLQQSLSVPHGRQSELPRPIPSLSRDRQPRAADD